MCAVHTLKLACRHHQRHQHVQVYTNMVGDVDIFDDPSAALGRAVEKTNEQMHRSVRPHTFYVLSCVPLR